MKSDNMKWLYTFFLLLVTVAWAVFTVIVVRNAMAAPTTTGILEASGTNVLLGALIAWNGNVNQYFFRKKGPPEQGGSSG